MTASTSPKKDSAPSDEAGKTTDPQQLIVDHLDLWTGAVTRKSTSGRGNRNKLELTGIKKLRDLILELAVRGKLVPQDASDEPASALLQRIEKEKAQLISKKELRKPKYLPPVGDDEKPFELPAGWEWVRLGSIGDWGAGATPARGNSSYYGGSIPWFKSGELTNDYISQSEETVTSKALDECSLRLNKIGDVLIAMYGATIGKTSILNVQGTTNQAVCACTPFNGISNVYLLTLLRASKSRFIGMGAGGAQPNISREKIIATTIAIPPTAEQHRIVAKVDELMALCDHLEAPTYDSVSAHQTLVETLLGSLTQSADNAELAKNWARLAKHFDTLFTTEHSIEQLKQTLLQLAVMGKLVPQDPDDEPASLLLQKLAAEKAQARNAGRKKPKFVLRVLESDPPHEIPPSWAWVRLEDLIFSFKNGLYKPAKFYSEAGVISLRMYNIQGGKIVFKDVRRLKVDEDELCQFSLEPGDILINRVNSKELVGKSAIAPKSNEPLVFESMNMRARPYKQYIVSDYLNKVLLSQFTKSYFLELAKEAVGQASLNQEQIGSTLVPLPPLPEQHRIVKQIEELWKYCETLHTLLQQSQETKAIIAMSLAEAAVF